MIDLNVLNDVLSGLISEYSESGRRLTLEAHLQIAERGSYLGLSSELQEKLSRTLGAIEALQLLKNRVNSILNRESGEEQEQQDSYGTSMGQEGKI